MRKSQLPFGIVFGLVVALCLGQVAWWIYFQVAEAARLEAAGRALAADDLAAALEVFEVASGAELADEAGRRRTMFAWEGATLSLLVMLGIVFFYVALVRERQARREQQRFLTGATHELKTPLATIRLGLESLSLDSLPTERRASYVEGMLREADRLERGLTNLLTAAGLETSARPREVGDLGDDVRRALSAFGERFRSQELDCATQLARCVVSRDPQAMRIVLHNLLDNAVKYSSRGDRIEVALEHVGDAARLTVTDTGCGIERDELARIFERFHRAGPDHIGGTGLGLALVREIVEAHGGRVRAESRGPGRGARFTIELPTVEEPASGPAPVEVPA